MIGATAALNSNLTAERAGSQKLPARSASRDGLAWVAAIVGSGHMLTDPGTASRYELDWTGRWHGRCRAVVRPGDLNEVRALLAGCDQRGIAVVPQGGNTGLVGGGIPDGSGQQLVLSLQRLRDVGPVERGVRQLTVGAGVTLAELQSAARSAGLEPGLDIGARDTATVGGLVACDAGGLKALRYGTARRRVAGMEAVLANGSVVSRMSGLGKDTAGYDLPALLVGSEGTLAVFTALRWSLEVAAPATATALVALQTTQRALQVAASLRTMLPSLELLELMTEAGVRHTLRYLGVAAPLPVSKAWILVRCAAQSDPQPELANALEQAGADSDAAMAVDAGQAARLLRIREAHPEAINQLGVSHKLDVGVPSAQLERFLTELPAVAARVAPAGELIVYGHVGDGNLHVNLTGLDPVDIAADAAVLQLAADCGGTISAEHGVGRHKTAYLPLVRSAAELDAMRSIKLALDPNGILNPGVAIR